MLARQFLNRRTSYMNLGRRNLFTRHENNQKVSPIRAILTYTGDGCGTLGPRFTIQSQDYSMREMPRDQLSDFLNDAKSKGTISEEAEASVYKDFSDVLKIEDGKYVYTGVVSSEHAALNSSYSFGSIKTEQPELTISKDRLLNVSSLLDQSITTAKEKAKINNKKLLVILGEEHFSRKSLLVQAIALDIAEKSGVKNLVLEASDSLIARARSETNFETAPNFATLVLQADKRKLKLIPADKDYTQPDIIRDLNMKIALTDLKDDAIFVTGLNHLKSFKEDRFLNSQYEIVAFNTANISKQQYEADSKISILQKTLLEYSYNPKNAIQVEIEGTIHPFTKTQEIINLAKSATVVEAVETKYSEKPKEAKPSHLPADYKAPCLPTRYKNPPLPTTYKDLVAESSRNSEIVRS